MYFLPMKLFTSQVLPLSASVLKTGALSPTDKTFVDWAKEKIAIVNINTEEKSNRFIILKF
jgi:hypothetical protein